MAKFLKFVVFFIPGFFCLVLAWYAWDNMRFLEGTIGFGLLGVMGIVFFFIPPPRPR